VKYKTVRRFGRAHVRRAQPEVDGGDETVNYQDGPLVPSKLTCEFLHTEKTDIKKLNDLVEGMIEIETDIGITYTMPNASRTGEPIGTVSGSGRIKFQAEGDEVPPHGRLQPS
jgi:hypothetical protein